MDNEEEEENEKKNANKLYISVQLSFPMNMFFSSRFFCNSLELKSIFQYFCCVGSTSTPKIS